MNFTKYENQIKLLPTSTPEVRALWEAEENRLRDLFEKDALEELGLENHPKAHDIFMFVWGRLYNEGQFEFRYVFDDLEEIASFILLKDPLK